MMNRGERGIHIILKTGYTGDWETSRFQVVQNVIYAIAHFFRDKIVQSDELRKLLG